MSLQHRACPSQRRMPDRMTVERDVERATLNLVPVPCSVGDQLLIAFQSKVCVSTPRLLSQDWRHNLGDASKYCSPSAQFTIRHRIGQSQATCHNPAAAPVLNLKFSQTDNPHRALSPSGCRHAAKHATLPHLQRPEVGTVQWPILCCHS